MKLIAVYWRAGVGVEHQSGRREPGSATAAGEQRLVERCHDEGVAFDDDARQPTMRRENTSVTKLVYTNPASVRRR